MLSAGRRRGRAVRFFVSAVLVAAVLVSASQAPWAVGAAASTTTTSTTTALGQVSIDSQQFGLSVPSYAVLGQNYSLKVVIANKGSIEVPIMVEVTAPLGAIYVHPRIVSADVPPGGSLEIHNFTMVAFGPPHQGGPFDVVALVYVFFPRAMSSPQLVDQASGVVSTIGPNPFPYAWLAFASVAVVSFVLVAVFYRDIVGKRDAFV